MSILTAEITPEMVAAHGLSADEYARVLHALGREPNLVELGIFSVMWSEHCSYKSSRLHLKKLPTEAPWVICGPVVGSFFRWRRELLYEQCSDHITEKMPSSTRLGSRPSASRMR